MKRILRKIKNIFYSLPFSMKGGEILTAQSSMDENAISINHQIQRNRLSDALMKSEVTQEVEELRYRTYQVAEESKNYSYLGDGIAVKYEKKQNDGNISFKQRNNLIVEDVLTALKRVDADNSVVDRYVLNIVYDDVPRFKLEKYCNFFEMNYNSKKGESEIKLHFDNLPDTYDSTSKMFLNELKRIKENSLINKNIFDFLIKMSFVTYKVNMEKDLIHYELDGLTMSEIVDNGIEYIVVYKISNVKRQDLTEKFYSKSMCDKYAKREPKENVLTFASKKNNKVCSICGKEVVEYDAAITEETYGKILCVECLEKGLIS